MSLAFYNFQTMTKITAIHGGGDWADAAAEYLVLPEGMDIAAEHKKWREWYHAEYAPVLRSTGKSATYVSLFDWLKNAGAREPSPDELTIYEDL